MRNHLKMTLLGASLLGALAAPALAANLSPDVTMPLTILGKPDAAAPVSVEVALPLRNVDGLHSLLAALHDPKSPQYHHWLSPSQFGLRFGPDSATVARVTNALRARGFTVVPHTRSLHISGPAALVQASFGTHLQIARTTTSGRGQRLVATGGVSLPPELAAAGATVMSFGRQEAHVMSRVVAGPLGTAGRLGPDGPYWYNDLKQAYKYPAFTDTVTVNGVSQPLNGTGATIGVLMSSDYLPSDVQAAFDHEGFSTTTGLPDPTLYDDVAIDGGGGTGGGAFAEVSLDTQEEITGAPGAHVILYNIPDLSDGSVFAGYVTAIEENRVDLLSASFGECELYYFPAYNGGTDQRGVLRTEDELFMQGNAQGITFLASSGDSAGKECTNLAYLQGMSNGVFTKGVSTPASDPNVTAVGGTNVVTAATAGSLDSTYVGENAWSDPEIPYDPYGIGVNATGGVWGAGGGVSAMWPIPPYQKLVTTASATMRSQPDVGMQVGGCPGGISKLDKKINFCNGGNNPNDGAGNTDRSAVVVSIGAGIGGGFYGLIGTSVSSPEFAGAMALLIEQQGRMGNLNYFLYQKAAAQAKNPKNAYFHTAIPGFNGLIQSNVSPTFSVSAGVGTPIVKNLVGAGKLAAAGLPQTATNP